MNSRTPVSDNGGAEFCWVQLGLDDSGGEVRVGISVAFCGLLRTLPPAVFHSFLSVTYEVGGTGLWFHLADENTGAQGSPGISSLPVLDLAPGWPFLGSATPIPERGEGGWRMLGRDYCSTNVNAEMFSIKNQWVGAAFVGRTPGEGCVYGMYGGGRLAC